MSYNGWKNYPTWAVNLWLSNDQGLASECEDVTRQEIELADDDADTDDIRYDVAAILKGWFEEYLSPDLGASFAADLYGWALGHVDWHEIANAWIEIVREADEYETA